MSNDDVLFGYRLRLFTLAAEIGVRAACRAMRVHHSTYYRWKDKVDRFGLEALSVRERRRPRMPNQIGPHLELGGRRDRLAECLCRRARPFARWRTPFRRTTSAR